MATLSAVGRLLSAPPVIFRLLELYHECMDSGGWARVLWYAWQYRETYHRIKNPANCTCHCPSTPAWTPGKQEEACTWQKEVGGMVWEEVHLLTPSPPPSNQCRKSLHRSHGSYWRTGDPLVATSPAPLAQPTQLPRPALLSQSALPSQLALPPQPASSPTAAPLLQPAASPQPALLLWKAQNHPVQ